MQTLRVSVPAAVSSPVRLPGTQLSCWFGACRRARSLTHPRSCDHTRAEATGPQVGTYQGSDNGSGRAATFPPKSKTIGGYTSTFIVHERFAIIIPEGYPLEFAGPVMCAGITM